MKKNYLLTVSIICILLCPGGSFSQDSLAVTNPPASVHEKEALELLIPPGQISSQLFKVFIPGKELDRDIKPELYLKMADKEKEQSFKPVIVAPNHVMVKNVEGEQISVGGTMIIYNIRKLDRSLFSASTRVVPQIKWNEVAGGEISEVSLVYDSYYYVGHSQGSFIWTTMLMVLLLLLITVILYARHKKEQWLGLISDTNGQVSMSLLQMLLWTLAVSYMVLAFGILRLNVPNIPDTLITLMLFAAGTSTFGHFQTKVQLRKETKLKEEMVRKQGSDTIAASEPELSVWGKFSTVFYADKYAEYPSMAKVQVLIWTVITLVLFVYLSIKEGKLWDVPSELVILMGISQATFLGRQQMAIQEVNMKIKDVGGADTPGK